MQEDQRWTYEIASWLNTANALGYVLGAATCLLLLRSFDAGQVFRVGLCATTGALLMTGIWSEWWFLLAMRVVAGCGAAWTFAAGGAVVAALYRRDPSRSGLASGIFFSGAGLGMAVSAVIAPSLIATAGSSAWPAVWVVLGVVAAAASFAPFRASGAVTFAPKGSPQRETKTEERRRATALSLYGVATVAYLLFAFAHTVYIFFVFAWTKEVGVPWYVGALMWAVLGMSVCASPFLWQRALKLWDPNRVLAVCCLQTCVGASLPLVSTSGASLFASAVLVGLSFFMAPTAVAVLVRVTAPERAWAAGIAAFAVVFSVGQAVGSWATGVVADRFSLDLALMMGAVGLALSAGIALVGRVPVAGGPLASGRTAGPASVEASERSSPAPR